MSGSPFGILEYFTSKDQASTTEDIASQSNDLQWKMYSQTRSDQLPLIQAGQTAINQLSKLMGEGGSLYDTSKYGVSNYQQSDYNKWLTQQGINSLLAGGSATGNLGSGNMGTALVNYAQNAAGAGYQDWYNQQMSSDTALYNRLMGIVSPAQTAAATVGSAGTSTAASTSSNSLYAQMLANQYSSQGLAGLGSTSGQIGNQILSGINAYNKANYLYDQENLYNNPNSPYNESWSTGQQAAYGGGYDYSSMYM